MVGLAARRIGRSFVFYTLVSLILSPILGAIVLWVADLAGARKCPSCAEPVRRDARKCRFCGADLAVAKG